MSYTSKQNAKRGKEKKKVDANNLRNTKFKITAELSKNAKQNAHAIVLSLLEVGIKEEFLKEKIPYITPENYDDVVTERALEKICGYPLCDAVITEKFDKQTYIIRHNKVYDITKRRNFCSDKCFEASEIILNQIPKTPLYLRASDKEIQKFKLYVPDLSTLKGKCGSLVNITGAMAEPEEDFGTGSEPSSKGKSKKKPKSKKSLNSTTDSMDCSSPSVASTDSFLSSSTSKEDSSKTLDSSNFGLSPSSACFDDSDLYLSEEGQKMSISDPEERYSPVTQDTGFVSKVKKRPTESKMNVGNQNFDQGMQTNDVLQDVFEMENALREWMTFESLRTILGDVYVRGMLEELGKTWEDYDTTAGLRLGIESKSRYISLCKRLDKEEMREKIEDAKDCGENLKEGELQDLEPVPNYEQLEKDVKNATLKVKAFFEGNEKVVSFSDALETINEEPNDSTSNGSSKSGNKKKGKSDSSNEENSITLPLIDSYSQNTWRRQITFDKLAKHLSSFTHDLGLNEVEIRRLVTALIATFDLSPHNICFKTSQWKFIALVMLKMLSVRYTVIQEAFKPREQRHDDVKCYLESNGLDPEYLDRLLSYLTEISYILSKYHKGTNPPPAQGTSFTTPQSSDPVTRGTSFHPDEVKGQERRSCQEVASDLVKEKDFDEKKDLNEEKESTNLEELD